MKLDTSSFQIISKTDLASIAGGRKMVSRGYLYRNDTKLADYWISLARGIYDHAKK